MLHGWPNAYWDIGQDKWDWNTQHWWTRGRYPWAAQWPSLTQRNGLVEKRNSCGFSPSWASLKVTAVSAYTHSLEAEWILEFLFNLDSSSIQYVPHTHTHTKSQICLLQCVTIGMCWRESTCSCILGKNCYKLLGKKNHILGICNRQLLHRETLFLIHAKAK